MNGADLAVLVVPFLDGSSNRVEAGTDLEDLPWSSRASQVVSFVAVGVVLTVVVMLSAVEFAVVEVVLLLLVVVVVEQATAATVWVSCPGCQSLEDHVLPSTTPTTLSTFSCVGCSRVGLQVGGSEDKPSVHLFVVEDCSRT